MGNRRLQVAGFFLNVLGVKIASVAIVSVGFSARSSHFSFWSRGNIGARTKNGRRGRRTEKRNFFAHGPILRKRTETLAKQDQICAESIYLIIIIIANSLMIVIDNLSIIN